MPELNAVRNNIVEFKKRVADAASKSGRTLKDITIVAAVKTQPQELIEALKGMGIACVGENRVQEMQEHYKPGLGLEWHFIGRLQTNKVKYIADKAALYHSLDRLSLAEELDKAGKKLNKEICALIEINAGGELSKGGVELENAYSFYKSLEPYSRLKAIGLMSVLPNTGDEDILRGYILKIKELYDKINLMHGGMRHMSVGMSNDYELAVKCGSNMLRPGRVLFGERS